MKVIKEVQHRTSLSIPEVIIPDSIKSVLRFLHTVHEMCPNLSLKDSSFSRRVIRNIDSPLEAVLRKSSEISFVYTYPFLFNFEDKLFVANTVLSTPLETIETFTERFRLPKMHSVETRHKCLINRKDIYNMGSLALKHSARASIEVGFLFEGETGFGRGPTQEFFTIMSREFMKNQRKMWRSDDNECEFVSSKNGLFPRPDANPEDFYVLGILVSKALQEGKLLEIELSSSFVKMINEQKVTIEEVDPYYAKILEFPEGLIGMEFCYPGIPELGKDDEVTEENLKSYVDFIVDNTVGKPILKLVEQFKYGFMRNGEVSCLSIFEGNELSRALCGDSVIFNERDLINHIVAEHGYSKRSREIRELISVLVSFDPDTQRKFCKFVTGSERLPPRGIVALNPPLSVARREGGDETLPTVSTCSNYLKLPSYSSKEVLRERLLLAITEGATFELS